MWQTLGTSANFIYQYDDSINGAEAVASALQDSCEHDLNRLEPLFGVAGGFGAAHQVTVLVEKLSGYAGVNGGYSTDVPMQISVNYDGGLALGDAEGYARAAFACELAEILMDYRNRTTGRTTWVKKTSSWEGLSNVCGAELHPTAYYRHLGPCSEAWLLPGSAYGPHGEPIPPPPRNYSWIDQNDTGPYGDEHPESFGCSALFINYLRSQLGISLSDVIQQAGSTLAETYTNLTRQTDATAAFKELIEKYLPTGQWFPVVTDDPFPFLDPQHRQVSLTSVSTSTQGAELSSGTKLISPGGFCPEANYDYSILENTTSVTFTATTHGFASPQFSWKVAGVPPTPTTGDGPAPIPVTVGVLFPLKNLRGGYTCMFETVKVQCDSVWVDSPYQRRFSVSNADFPGGSEIVPVTVEVFDQYADPDVTTTRTGYASLETTAFVWGEQYLRDHATCVGRLLDLMRRHEKYQHINILLTLPDPPIDEGYMIRVIGDVSGELQALAREEPDLAPAVASTIGMLLGIPGQGLLEGKLEILTVQSEGSAGGAE